MHAAADRPEFAPPPQPGLLRALVLAVLAHLLLVAALMHGLQWQREAENAVAEAELWSALPQEAAPREVAVPPPPPPPPPQPVVKAPPAPPPPPPAAVQRDAEIALEREKQKRELEKQKLAELEKQKQAELEKKERERRKLEAQKKREEAEAKRKEEEERKLAEAKKKKEEEKRRQQQEEARLAKQREDNLKRIQSMAGTGAPTSAGSAERSAGPSASWAAKVQARVRPNIVFTASVSGNPRAEVEVRTSPDGTIVGRPRLVRSSGVPAWDEAVIRALERTGELPRDVDGRVPSPVVIGFRPND